ncbi:response regulator transcription factor [bacterium]|nr:response regulator transcription factor [bacterium]
MQTILVIEDEMPILVAIEDVLSDAGYSVLTARNGQQGLKYALEENYHLIILDLMLPRLDGLTLLKRLRKQDPHVPVIILTAKSQEMDKVIGFNSGADDYMIKPFGIHELVARVKVRLKNAQVHTQMLENYELEGITFDFKAVRAYQGKKKLNFSVKELELLQYLISHKGRAVSREKILEDVWKYNMDQAPLTRSVDNYILKLRQKVEKNPERPKHLLTVHSKGYCFED